MTVPFQFAKTRMAFLLPKSDGETSLVFTNETPRSAIAECVRVANNTYKLLKVDAQEFFEMLSKHYEESTDSAVSTATKSLNDISSEDGKYIQKKSDLMATNSDAPVESFVFAMLADAIKKGASDVYIEPGQTMVNIRYRIDGVVHAQDSLEIRHLAKIVRNIKIQAKIDPTSRKHSDGKISTGYMGEQIDVRVATMAVENGEKVTMRLHKLEDVRTLGDIGYDANELATLKRMLGRTSGIVLFVGRAGSGKTTSLYASAEFLNDGSKTIQSIEDPVERHLKGIQQTQVNEVAGITFASFLRGLVRHRCDVAMVGEIRDLETARLAISAAIADHLILATIHARSAAAALPRLVDMGIEPFQVSSGLNGVVEQKLVRRLCPDCKKPHVATQEEKQLLGIDSVSDLNIYEPVGCEKCLEGYKGQVGIFNFIEVDREIRKLLKDEDSEMAIEDYSSQFHPGIIQSCINKVILGLTSLSELLNAKRGLRE